jgi:hypothetical protein
LLLYPPGKYRFVDLDAMNHSDLRSAEASRTFVRLLAHVAAKLASSVKILASFRGFLTRFPEDLHLLYMSGMLSFSGLPFVTDAEDPLSSWMGVPYDIKALHSAVESNLSSNRCKMVVYWNGAARDAISRTCNIDGFGKKIEIIPPALPMVPHRNRHPRRAIRMLFLGSANIDTPAAFYCKGVTSPWTHFDD